MPKSITKFFQSLGFKMKNDRWSWGALNGNALLLRSWLDQYSPRDAEVVVLRTPSGYAHTDSAGLPERRQHIEALKSGDFAGYTVIAEVEDPDVQPRKIKDFRDDVVFPIDSLRVRDDGTLMAKLGKPVAVATLMDHAKSHRTHKLVELNSASAPTQLEAVVPAASFEEATPNHQGDDLDERAKRFAQIEIRIKQSAFRIAVFKACSGRCVISGCDVPEALEAAHRHGRDWRAGHNDASDGILLRRDLHALYDRGLLRIEDGTVTFNDVVLDHYGDLLSAYARCGSR